MQQEGERGGGGWLDKCEIYNGISWRATFAEQVQREVHLTLLPQRDNYKLPVGLCELPVALGLPEGRRKEGEPLDALATAAYFIFGQECRELLATLSAYIIMN